MGKCARRTKKIVKAIAKELTPPGVRLIATIVEIVATTDWTNSDKRERAVEMASGALKAAGTEAKEVAIRAAVEASVAALKQGQDALAELGEPDEDDAAEIEKPE